MPLHKRRRPRPPQPPPPPRDEPPTFPAGKSPLELLPLELLIEIFILSQNTDLVLISKAIYHRLGYKLSDALMIEFCRRSYLQAPSSSSSPSSDCPHCFAICTHSRALMKLVRLRGCTPQTYALWIQTVFYNARLTNRWEEVGLNALDGLRQDWLKPENIGILTHLIKERLWHFRDSQVFPRRFPKGRAKLCHTAGLFLHESVDVDWLVTLKSCYDSGKPPSSTLRYVQKCDAVIFRAMAHRRNLTHEMINRVFPNGELRGNHRLQKSFNCGNIVIIRYLLANGFAPTAEQLSGFHGGKIVEAQQVDQGGIGDDDMEIHSD